jgi:hypothetical protein
LPDLIVQLPWPLCLLLLLMQASGTAPELRRSLSCYSSCYLVLDLSANPWRVVHMNEPAREVTGANAITFCDVFYL